MMNKGTDNGWLLCPSKSFPGKFYYFNIHNGESAWSLYDSEKGMFKNDANIQNKVVNSPKPITLPDNRSASTCLNHSRRYSSTFGPEKFPKYSNKDANSKKDQYIQTDTYFNQATSTPIYKNFQSKPNTAIKITDWSNSSIWSDFSQISSKSIPKRSIDTNKPLLKESTIKPINEENNFNCNDIQNGTILNVHKVQNTERNDLKRLGSNDLRLLLRAKRRKSNYTNDTIESTKPTFNNDYNKGTNTQLNTESTKERYIVVDFDVLLQEFDFIISYVNKDDTCNLYIPKIVETQLKSATIGNTSELKSDEILEHGRNLLAARRIYRRLENFKSKLNLSECIEDTRINQIIKCCSDIKQRNIDVMLITNDEELLKIAKSHQIKASTIQDLQNYLSFDNNINKLTKNKENLFLQDVTMLEPLSLTDLLENNNDYDENDNSDDDISYITSDIDNLNITNPVLNMRRKEKNTYKINKSNDNDITQSSLNNDNIKEQQTYNQELMINASREIENTNHYDEKSINCELKSFYKNYDIVKNNLCSRLEEFSCCLDQIIEEFIQIILQEKLQDVTKPTIWLKQEGLESVKEIYKDDKNICNIIKKIIDLYTSLQGDKNIQPYNFMSLFECWYRLIQAVEEKKPNHVGIHEIKHYLDILKDNLSQANDDDDDDDEELIIPSPRSENEETFRCFLKNPSEVVEYIRKHFSECKVNKADGQTNVAENGVDIKILRTLGKHLNNFTIDNTKKTIVLKECLNNNDDAGNVSIHNTPKVLKNISYQSINNDDNPINDNQLNDQSLNNDNETRAYAIMQKLFTELSLNFKTVHDFIDTNVKNYNEDMSGDKREYLKCRTEKIHTHITDVIEKLNNIITRESSENSVLKKLLIKTGPYDKKTARYRSMVMKCVGQASILEQSLKLMLALINKEDVSDKEELV